MDTDYYHILGVKRGAKTPEIKKAFKVLARKYHPDKNPDDKVAEQKFKDISEAHETLTDEKKRSVYDSKMTASFDFNRWGQAFNKGRSKATDFTSPFKKEPPKGNNLRVDIELTLQEICTGTKKTIKVNRLGRCPTCDGTGAKSNRSCSVCSGVGSVRTIQRSSMFGNAISVEQCRKCYGSGVEIEHPCLHCQGKGRIKNEASIRVNIPNLVKSENFIVLNGEGDAGKAGGPKGDLHIDITEIPDSKFRREGEDLFIECEVTITDLVLGNVIKVPTLFGEVDMKIPAGHQPHINLGIKGKGLTENSNLFVIPRMIVPTDLNTREQEIFEELRNLETVISI